MKRQWERNMSGFGFQRFCPSNNTAGHNHYLSQRNESAQKTVKRNPAVFVRLQNNPTNFEIQIPDFRF